MDLFLNGLFFAAARVWIEGIQRFGPTGMLVWIAGMLLIGIALAVFNRIHGRSP
jgi:hypothetical protein